MQAVLTGDIVNSTRLSAAQDKKIRGLLKRELEPYINEFYRGDSFQLYMPIAADALQVALLCRTAAISVTQNETGFTADVRVSIGIAKTRPPAKTPGTAKGEAFVLSGRAFDGLAKNGARLSITNGNQLANEGLAVIADYCNAIYSTMTGKQALVIFELLKGKKQQDIVSRLKKSKSTISQHVNAARWPEIERLLQHYRNIIDQL